MDLEEINDALIRNPNVPGAIKTRLKQEKYLDRYSDQYSDQYEKVANLSSLYLTATELVAIRKLKDSDLPQLHKLERQ